MDWFKMHCEARTDAKLRALTDSQHRVWFNMLCLTSEQKDRGLIPAMDRFLLSVEVASGDIALLESTIEILTKLRIVGETDEGIRFLNYTKRQYAKPSDQPESTRERAKRSREKRAEEKSNANVTPCHATDTDTDTDADTDTERKDIIVPTVVETPISEPELEGAAVGSKEPKSKRFIFGDEHLELAERLKFRILDHKPTFKVPNSLDQWANTIRLMIEQDGRSPGMITEVIDWCQKDPFWQSNVLSADALRKQFDRLEAQMTKSNKPRRSDTPQPKSSAAMQRVAEKLRAQGG